MSPALNTTPLEAMPAMTTTVVAFVGRENGSAPMECKMGRGIQRTRSVHNPMHDVTKLGYRPNGGGYTASCTLKKPSGEESSAPSVCGPSGI